MSETNLIDFSHSSSKQAKKMTDKMKINNTFVLELLRHVFYNGGLRIFNKERRGLMLECTGQPSALTTVNNIQR